MQNIGSKVTYLSIGLGIGAVVGVLCAPKSGEETREYLAQKAEEGNAYAQDKARDLHERAEGVVVVEQFEAGQEVYRREKAKAQHA